MSSFKKIFLAFALFVVPALGHAELCDKMFVVPTAASTTVGKPHLIIFSAPSGGGKTTLANLLFQDFPNLTQSISSTTRPPRGTEKDGVDYHFLTKPEFEKRVKEGKFAEFAEVHGNYYGTEIATIRNSFAAGKSVLALVDVTGAKNLRASFPSEVYTVFINPPDMATLESRLTGRGTDTAEVIQKRLANARKEMEEAKNFDQVVINDQLERAHQELKALFVALHLIPSTSPVQKP